jgi:tetratricopeptide (TPR) repeat protein
VELRRKSFQPDDPAIAKANQLWGTCLTELGRYEEAEVALLEAYNTLSASADSDPQLVRNAADFIIELYEAWGKADAAAEWQARPSAP